VTTDDFTNGEILEATYPAVGEKLADDFREHPAIPIVTGFLARVSTQTVGGAFFC
jgi:aspartate kinase